jgi:hypothetical protein
MSCADLCPLEKIAFAPDSPRPVESTEVLWRWLLEPSNIRKENVRLKALLNHKDLFGPFGLSLWRASHTNLAETAGIATRTGQLFRGVVELTVSVIRSQRLEGKRVLCVLDDTICDQDNNRHSAHCGIRVCKESNLNEADREQVFKDLLNVVSQESRKIMYP